MIQKITWYRRIKPLILLFAVVSLLCLAIVPAAAAPASATSAQATAASMQETAGLAADGQKTATGPVAARLSAGLMHSAIINYDSQLYVWGDNTYGQLGLAGIDYSDNPQLLTLPGKVVEVSLGSWHTLVLLADGSVWSFGRNAFGQLGNGNTANAAVPARIEGLPRIAAIAAGAMHSLALGQDGSVWAWGNNTDRQVGDVNSETIKDTEGKVLGSRCLMPVKIVKDSAAAIAAGGMHSMYLGLDGHVYTWGGNARGQLGDGTTQPHAQPLQVPGLDNISSIAAGYQHCLAVSRTADFDSLMAWGDDALGQLGCGSNPESDSYRSSPVRVDTTADQIVDNDRIIMIQAGYSQSVAVTAAPGEDRAAGERQRLLVWGSNGSGQLALGQPGSQNRPVAVSGTFNNWTGSSFLPFDAIASGGYHLLVLSSKGLLAAAGRGDRGQLGNWSILDRSQLTPVHIPDVIRPAWLTGSELAVAFNDTGEMVVRWPAAQDNQMVAGYRIRLRRPDGQIQSADAGSRQSWTFKDVSDRLAYEIIVMAYDAGSVQAGEETLGYLAGYALPAAGIANGAKPADYFADNLSSVWQVDFPRHHWQPDLRNRLLPLEVPWDISSIYGQDGLPEPANWQIFKYAAWVTAGLLALMLFDLLRRKIRQPAAAA